jgi:hypothetical protein
MRQGVGARKRRAVLAQGEGMKQGRLAICASFCSIRKVEAESCVWDGGGLASGAVLQGERLTKVKRDTGS